MTVLDLFKLTGKYCLVTGGAKGLGFVINEALLEAGASSLVFCGRGRHGSLEEEKAHLQEKYPDKEIIGITCDISKEESVISMVQQIKETIGRIDILINSAGVTWAAPTIDQTIESWHRVIDTNLTGTFLVTREIANEFMIPQSKGVIINISSLLAILGAAEIPQIGYSASKSALLGLTRQLAIEWAPYDIRVNAIVPSFFEGIDSMAKMFTNEDSPVREILLEMIPTNRFAKKEDLQAVVVFLASEASSYVTGQYIVLDGGYSIK